MRGLSERYSAAAAAIDAANADDPTAVVVRGHGHPLAQVHGTLADEWADRLLPADAALESVELVRLAARAHHLRRWEVPRASYPEGRPGYLRWRKDQKSRHADLVAGLLAGAGYLEAEIGRVQALIRREGLGSDAHAQAVEDAACLVFVETQLTDVAQRLAPEHVADVIRKTARKMSDDAIALLGEVPLDADARRILGAALGSG